LYHLREPELCLLSDPLGPARGASRSMEAAEGRIIRRVRPLDLERVLVVELGASAGLGGSGEAKLRIDLAPTSRPLALYDGGAERPAASLGPRRGRRPSGSEQSRAPKPYSLLSLPETVPAGIAARAGAGSESPEAPEHTRRWKGARALAAALVSSVAGVDPALAAAAVREAGADPERAWAVLAEIARRLASGPRAWHVYRLAERGERMDGFADAFAVRARESAVPGYVEHLRRRASQRARRETKRLERLRENLAGDLADAARSSEYRHFGDLLATYRHLLRAGMSEITVKDFSGDRSVTVPLDPARSPDRNIRAYFTKARKGEKGAFIIKDRALAVDRDIESRRAEIARIETLRSAADLIPLVPPDSAPRGRGRGDDEPRRFRSFPIDERHTAYVGRSDGENDILTHEFAAATDLWFHAQDVPGSHVILKGAHRSTPHAVIEKAAAIAAAFSKARNSKTVPVIYAEKRHVRRPRKSKPGAAVCQRSKTIFVKPGIPDEADET
ncbi:MAG: DUF814 domain-containing protein, partial [Candidatus Latescibacterota bacterium]